MADPSTPVAELLRLNGRVAIVTGASGGIGGAIASRLADAGATVIVHYRNNKIAAENLVTAIVSAGGRAATVKADLCAEQQCRYLLEQTAMLAGPADILVNNAGIQPVTPLPDMTEKELANVLQTDISAPVVLTRLLAESLQNQSSAASRQTLSVVNIASIEGSQPAPAHSHYASAKAALLMFTRAAAQELGPLGVRVNAVSPGLIDREGLRDAWPEGVQRYTTAAPLGRIGHSMDVANAVLFLCSAAAGWISGTNLVVDGGVSCAPTW